MKNNLKLLSVSLLAFVVGLTAANYAMSDTPATFKVAYVNVPKVVESSAQVKALKVQNEKNIQELAKLSETAQIAINKEKDATKQKALREKYHKEFQTKRTNMAKAYEKKLLEIDKNIATTIDKEAKSQGYDIVLAKGAVLSGGTDITDSITKLVK